MGVYIPGYYQVINLPLVNRVPRGLGAPWLNVWAPEAALHPGILESHTPATTLSVKIANEGRILAAREYKLGYITKTSNVVTDLYGAKPNTKKGG